MLNWKGTLVLVPGSGSLNKLGVKTELKSKVNGFFLSWMSLPLKVKAEHWMSIFFILEDIPCGTAHTTVAHNCHGKTKNLTAKPKTSRQKQKPHGKIKIPHDKTKNLTAKPKTSRQNQILHSKKPNTPRQKQIPTAKPKSFCSLWSIWFCRGIFCLVCREVFCFCREVFVFAVTRLWATIQLPYDTKENRFTRDRKQ